ncbi:hypothetical protein LINPERHAP2_LOCUS41265 [Linum perenne]
MKLTHGTYVEPEGRGGGLALWWTKDVSLQILRQTPNYIDVKWVEGEDRYITFVYGAPIAQEREKVWEEIEEFKRPPSTPWCLIGDFNAIRTQDEKQGGAPVALRRLQQFNDAIFRCMGEPFTWCNNNRQGNEIKQRIDRGFCNGGWNEIFPRSRICHELRYRSDHCPIVLQTEYESDRRGKRRFFYEKGWQMMDGYNEVVEATWVTGMSTEGNLGRCSQNLRRWKSDTFGANRVIISDLKRDLEHLNRLPYTAEVYNQMDAKQRELERQWKLEEEFWASRANVEWARFGDRNTRFFHLSTIQRRRRNSIVKVKDEDGRWIDEPREVRAHIKGFSKSCSLPRKK